jgi:pyruvate kinase
VHSERVIPGQHIDRRSPIEVEPPLEPDYEPMAAAARDELVRHLDAMRELEREAAPLIDAAHPDRRESAINLVHYLALRRTDLRPLQARLAALGLSSLGRAEAAVHASVRTVADVLARLVAHREMEPMTSAAAALARGQARLSAHTRALLGPDHGARHVRIMVTMPSEAAHLPTFVEECLGAGMDIMRINCAHDDPDAWLCMIRHLRAAESRTRHRARILMDLAGPKIRTGPIAGDAGVIRLTPGDVLRLCRDEVLGLPATSEQTARIACTLPAALAGAAVGHRVWLDDGKLGGRIVEVAPDALHVCITHGRPQGARLRPDKGINLPDTVVDLPAITRKDLEDLPLVAAHADLIGLSFARSPADVEALQDRLAALGASEIGVILKAETRQGFDRLPEMLLTLMRTPASGVMIARGDLAVECGYERLAEVQEEILWLCEASHTPVIWATQVLETLAKKGVPTRSEVTDAALAQRAECVMLNKGPHILRAVEFLDGVLRRMAAHQRKKTPTLRPLRVATRFGRGADPPDVP